MIDTLDAPAFCADCQKPLGRRRQESPPGIEVPQFCAGCEQKRWITHMLMMLPDPGDRQWDSLNEFEQSFLVSVRPQFQLKGTLSDKQVEVLKRIYEKHN